MLPPHVHNVAEIYPKDRQHKKGTKKGTVTFGFVEKGDSDLRLR